MLAHIATMATAKVNFFCQFIPYPVTFIHI